jgi:hypothetical protein
MGFQYLKNEAGHFVCPNCGVTKERQNTMHYHLKRCTGNTHNCPHCDSTFIQQHSLDIHIQTEHPAHAEKQLPEYKCPFPECTYKCLSKGNARVHYIRTHCKDLIGPLKGDNNICLACNEQFASQPAFIYHTPYCIRLLPTEQRCIDLQGLCEN